MRSIWPSFVVAPPTGAKVRTRPRLSTTDEEVLLQVGEYLGSLAGGDLALGCRLGRVPDERRDRKRALTPVCSSRWAGAITRTTNDQWTRAYHNLQAERTSLRRAIAGWSNESRRRWAARPAGYAGMRPLGRGGPSSGACRPSRPGWRGSRRGWWWAG
jgi:hypothetical protein